MRKPLAAAAALLAVVAACAPRPTLAPTLATESLGPGISWWRTDDPRGPWRMTVARIDLSRSDVSLRAVHARDSLTGRETVSSLAARATAATDSLRVRVAINADFFELRSGRSENNQVSDGEWWVGRMLTDSPYDTWDNVHSQFALTHDKRGAVGRYVLDARAWGRAGAVPVLGVNHAPAGTYEGTSLYTPRFGARTPRDSSVVAAAPRRAEVPLKHLGMRGDTLLYRVVREALPSAATDIPRDGAVFVAYGDRVPAVTPWRSGDTIRVWLGTTPAMPDGRPPAQLVGGWPRVVEDGVNIAAHAATREGTISRNAEARHPRSAVGVSRDGRTLWLFVVDGRSERSVGMTLVELGDAMRALGAWDALNFDGGGSTTLVIDGRVVNVPADATGERSVGNALLVMQRKGKP